VTDGEPRQEDAAPGARDAVPSEREHTGDGVPYDDSSSPDLVPVESDVPALDHSDQFLGPVDIHKSWARQMRDPNLDGSQEWRPWEFKLETTDGEMFMGRHAKAELIDAHQENQDDPLFIGWNPTINDGIREIGVPKHSWNEHFSMFGTTGKGKSTVQQNFLLQIAQKGYGFCFYDPKGDAVDDLLQQLPDHRTDDIIYIEPASPEYDQVVGLNFLEPGSFDSETEYNREVEGIIEDLVAILRGGEYWGPRMEGITKNVARAMIRSQRNYTLVDMYHVLVDHESRQQFAEAVSNEGFTEIQEYTEQIAKMDDEKVDPVMRRIQNWVEDPNARSIVAHRKTSFDIADAIDNNKIILVKLDLGYEELQKVVGTAIMRRIWSEISKRNKNDDENYNPYFTVFDEFHRLATEDMDLQDMLATARSANMPIMVASQNPGHIPDNILEQIKANTDTLLCMGMRNPDHAYEIGRRFGEELDSDEIIDLPKYRLFVQLTVEDDGELVSTPAFETRIFPPHWPIRTQADVGELVEESLDKYGVNPRGSTLDETELILKQSAGDDYLETAFLEAVWTEQLRNQGEATTVRAAIDGFETRTGRRLVDFPDGLDITAEYVEVERPATETTRQQNAQYDSESENDTETIRQHSAEVAITEAGIQAVLAQDDDRAAPGDTHRALLRRGFEDFSLLGMDVSITKQVSEVGANDATGYRPINLDVDPTAIEDALADYRETYPMLTELTDCREVSLEAEHDGISKPAHPIENLRRAFHDNQLAVFLVANGDEYGVSPEKFANDLENIFTDPPFVNDKRFVLPGKNRDDPDNTRDEPVRILYNKSERLELGQPDDDRRKYALVPKGERTTWVDTGDSELLLYGGSGEDAKQRGRIRQEEVNFASTNPFQFWGRYDSHNDEWIVYPDNGPEKRYNTQDELEDHWTPVYRPLLPEAEFAAKLTEDEKVPGEVEYPDEDDWLIMTVRVQDLVETPTEHESDDAKKQDESQTTPEESKAAND
jgi:hypothetical protein